MKNIYKQPELEIIVFKNDTDALLIVSGNEDDKWTGTLIPNPGKTPDVENRR